MAKRPKLEAGFDVDGAIAKLHRLALAEGAVPQDDFRARDPLQTAIAHAFLHGVGTERCEHAPCRLGGMCLALYELTTYRGEHGGPRGAVLRAAVETERFHGALRRDVEAYARAIAQLLKRGEEQHELEARSAMSMSLHPHEDVGEHADPQEMEQPDRGDGRAAGDVRGVRVNGRQRLGLRCARACASSSASRAR